MPRELIVILKDENRTYRERFLIYEDFMISQDEPLIKDAISKALLNFKGQPHEVRVKIDMTM